MLFELGPCIVGFETTAIFPFVDFVELEIEFFATLVFFFDTEQKKRGKQMTNTHGGKNIIILIIRIYFFLVLLSLLKIKLQYCDKVMQTIINE